MLTRSFSVLNVFLSFVFLFSAPIFGYAKSDKFHSPYLDISLVKHLKLTSKTEQKNEGFYRYVFGSSGGDNAALQMRVIVSSKSPEIGQSLEAFQTSAVASMSIMFMESYGLYQYLSTPENKKVLAEKPSKLKLGKATFTAMTMYFGSMEASFLVTNSHSMTYAFTLISRNANEQTRKNNLNMLINQLQSIRFGSPGSNR